MAIATILKRSNASQGVFFFFRRLATDFSIRNALCNRYERDFSCSAGLKWAWRSGEATAPLPRRKAPGPEQGSIAILPPSGPLFIGAGLGVRAGGATCGDDALALALSRLTKIDIQWIYLLTDGLVLGLSITYIPLAKLGWSLLTVVLSGQIIGWIQKLGRR